MKIIELNGAMAPCRQGYPYCPYHILREVNSQVFSHMFLKDLEKMHTPSCIEGKNHGLYSTTLDKLCSYSYSQGYLIPGHSAMSGHIAIQPDCFVCFQGDQSRTFLHPQNGRVCLLGRQVESLTVCSWLATGCQQTTRRYMPYKWLAVSFSYYLLDSQILRGSCNPLHGAEAQCSEIVNTPPALRHHFS